MPATPATVEETLAYEAQWAPRAGISAILAGLFTLAGSFIPIVSLKDAPSGVTLTEGLRDIAEPLNPAPGARVVDFLHDNLLALTAGQISTCLAAVFAALAMIYLFRATRARRPETGQATLVALAIGAVAIFVGGLVLQFSLNASISDFASSSDKTSGAVEDALRPSAAASGQLIGLLGKAVFAFALVMVSLNAMRVGLLTRFLGILGILAGVTSLLINLPIVTAFWLLALGALFFGRMPSGTPPAWETGRAEPWPTRQQMIEQQGDKPGGRSSRNTPPPASSAPPPADPLLAEKEAGSQHPRSKKKKRRR